ncbi:hypothetical protein [Marinicella rhabdoformis]|uniref:hypothetical protein n=1 Tax=Marinicella rhabdoformis TaxID=2580566 RepID=UPI0012AEDCA0|nr:hypothetical protein [Marinicella rhabdoformis]
MKKIIPFLSLFLASCATYHTHHVEDDYYDDYEGHVAYINSYNYYPDRWGINYSSAYYSPYRYPRIGFYYNDCFSWTWGCYGYGSFNTWSSWSPWYYGGIAYSTWHYDDYWWYNHWRNRNHPRYGGRNDSRREVLRLADRQRGRGYKNNNTRRNTVNRNRVSRERSRYNKPVRQQRVRQLPSNRQQNRSRQPQRNRQAVIENRTYRNRSTGSQSIEATDSRNELRRQTRERAQNNWVARDLDLPNRQNQHERNRYTGTEYNRNNVMENPSQRLRHQQKVNQNVNTNSAALYNRPNRMNKPAQASNARSRSNQAGSNKPRTNPPRSKQTNTHKQRTKSKSRSNDRQRASSRNERKNRN